MQFLISKAIFTGLVLFLLFRIGAAINASSLGFAEP
jgi:hypothetical protein